MDYNHGLARLHTCLAQNHPEHLAAYATLAGRLQSNLNSERLFGGDETNRRERAQICSSLNDMALAHCDISFYDFCTSASLEDDQVVSSSRFTNTPNNYQPRFMAQDGALGTTRTEQQPLPITIKMELRADPPDMLQINVIESPHGELRSKVTPPYTPDELIVVLKALGNLSTLTNPLTNEQMHVLEKLDLIEGQHIRHDLVHCIGKHLFKTMFSGPANTALQMALAQGRQSGALVNLQVRFDEHSVDLARYPWELLYDGRRQLLTGTRMELTRYISYPEAIAPLQIQPPLNVLYVGPRPTNLVPLPANADHTSMRQAFAELELAKMVQVAELPSPTYSELADHLTSHAVHILHFDGHGMFARTCPRCGQRNYAHLIFCDKCSTNLSRISPEGYLAFEDSDRCARWIKASQLASHLQTPLRLALLLACSSGTVRGDTVFGGVGPALIQAGVPAVVAMQLPISTDGATAFTHGFYRALARNGNILGAVSAGRLRLDEDEWFIPTMYLRSDGANGRLFDFKR